MQQSHIPALRDARRAEQAISTEASAALGGGKSALPGVLPQPLGVPSPEPGGRCSQTSTGWDVPIITHGE